MKMLLVNVILSTLFFSTGEFFPSAHALVAVESLSLGNFGEGENKSDPLNYVFSKDLWLKKASDQEKKALALYRGFYEEGKNLANYCKKKREIKYPTEWQKMQVERSVMGLIQYTGLLLTTKAIASYAKALEFSPEDYTHMSENLVGNFCSNNISVISKRDIENRMAAYFKEDAIDRDPDLGGGNFPFKLPSIYGNTYFPERLGKDATAKKALEQEFLYTVKLFQSLCSWSGNPDNPGLLPPVLKHPAVMAFFNREMSGQRMNWKEVDNSLFLEKSEGATPVWCDNLLCRKTPRELFLTKVYYSVGGTDLSEDFRRLYCEDFRNSDYRPKESDPRLAKIMKSISFDEENFINSQFIALLTGVPDFLLGAENFREAQEFMRANVDQVWTQWAKKSSDNFSRDLYFEEPLTLELVDAKQYQTYRTPKLKVAFDVNLGEFDRVNQRSGKIKVTFQIKVANSFLAYYQSALKENGLVEEEERLRLKNRLKLQLTRDVEAARKKFLIPPWKGDLAGLIANEITSQILSTPAKILDFSKGGINTIDIEVHYGLFALKYLNHQFGVQKSQKKEPLGPSAQ